MRKKNRRGVALVLIAALMVGMLTFLAIVFNFSRIYAQKNELQTSADAAALAGVLELLNDTTIVTDSAISFSLKNPVQKQNVAVNAADVYCGVWDDAAQTFSDSSTTCGGRHNATAVTARDSAVWLFPLLVSATGKEVKARAHAWLAYVDASRCVKPIAIDYAVLTTALDPDPTLDPNRDLTTADIAKLSDPAVAAALTFTLRFNTTVGSGNFGAIRLPGSQGANDYINDFVGCNPNLVGKGTVLDLENGGMTGPTGTAMDQLCQPLTPSSKALDEFGPTIADCFDGNGNLGIPVKVVFFVHPAIPPGGSDMITVQLIGLITLDHLTWDGVISGHFLSLNASGSVSSAPTPLRRPVLVR